MSNTISETSGTAPEYPKHSKRKMQVSILTGFLGSGKTTCLNAFLQSPEAAETAVLINEFGEIDVDGAVLSAGLTDGSKLMTLPNGCVCCEVQKDLAEALLALVARSRSPRADISRCIIETTGLADPGAIIRGIGHDPGLKKSTAVEQTVTVCAADRLIDQLERFDEVGRQIGIADRVVVTKSDLVSQADRIVVHQTIAAMNPVADIQVATHGALDPMLLLGAHRPLAGLGLPEHPGGHHHHHTTQIQTFTVQLDNPLDPGRFRDVMSFMIMRHAENLLRIKGLVRFSGQNSPRLLNGVHDVFSSESAEPDVLVGDQAGFIVFIGVDLPEQTIRMDLRSAETH